MTGRGTSAVSGWPVAAGQGPLIAWLIAALAACAGLNLSLRHLRPSPSADLIGLRLEAEGAVETAALLGLGMRRLAADLALIRMIIYYGSPEDPSPDDDGHGHDPHGHGAHDHGQGGRFEGGDYPLLAPMGMRLLDLDPAFSYGALFSAGALAFNLDRPDEALEVLEYALKRDPKNIQFQAYVAAIGFHKRGDPEGVIRILEPFLSAPGCPTMIKSMMAFLYRRTGRTREAIRLYLDIYENSRDKGYRLNAEKRLRELGAG